MLPNGSLGISTRRGEIYVVENPTSRRPFSENLLPDSMKFWVLFIKMEAFMRHKGES